MCMYCRDLDDYERRHGHECDEDCMCRCEKCDIMMCRLSEEDEDRPYRVNGDIFCRQHADALKNQDTGVMA